MAGPLHHVLARPPSDLQGDLRDLRETAPTKGDIAQAGRCPVSRERRNMIEATLATGIALFARAVTGVRGRGLGGQGTMLMFR